jgi:large subunit ribosomal protein L28
LGKPASTGFSFVIHIQLKFDMSKVCQLTGKRPVSGNNVSHSNRKTRRRFLPNLQKKRFFVPELDEWVQLRVSTSAMRSINKLGLFAYIKKLESKGLLETNI